MVEMKFWRWNNVSCVSEILVVPDLKYPFCFDSSVVVYDIVSCKDEKDVQQIMRIKSQEPDCLP